MNKNNERQRPMRVNVESPIYSTILLIEGCLVSNVDFDSINKIWNIPFELDQIVRIQVKNSVRQQIECHIADTLLSR